LAHGPEGITMFLASNKNPVAVVPIEILLVTPKQAAEALQVSERTVWNLIEGGYLDR
jgi:hypothetical protein